MENMKFIDVFFVAAGALFMAIAFSGNLVMNFLLDLVNIHSFASNTIAGILTGLVLSTSGSLFWLGVELSSSGKP